MKITFTVYYTDRPADPFIAQANVPGFGNKKACAGGTTAKEALSKAVAQMQLMIKELKVQKHSWTEVEIDL